MAPKSHDVSFDASNVESSLCAIVDAVLAPEAAEAAKSFEVVSGGITNRLFKCTFSGVGAHDPVLVRVFGGEGMIDRVVDNAVFASLSEANLGPGCYGTFKNGRVEQFLDDCRTLKPADLSNREIAQGIAAELARVHGWTPPSEAVGAGREPGLFKQLWAWHAQAIKVSFDAESVEARDLATLELHKAEDEIKLLETKIPSSCAVAFCNNDLLAGNIMQNNSTGKLHLIDFEYGGFNYISFDIANHFNEYAGGTDDGYPDYSKFPSEDHMRSFCESYIQSSGGDASVQDLMKEIRIFLLTDQWYWGLWAVNMAAESGCDEFPYLIFSRNRLQEYWAKKEEFLDKV